MTRSIRIAGFWFCMTLWLVAAGCQPGEGLSLGGNNAGEDEYTLMLIMLNGPDHVAMADLYLERTKQFTNWAGLYVVNKDDSSTLYWGRYRTREAAMNNLRTAKEYVAPASKQKIYQMAAIVPLPGKDIGPAEWNLKNADGEHTVLVAVFQDLPPQNYYGRKARAVDLCKQLRAQGTEAYFFHDTSRSGVTIGMFSEKAMQTRRVERKHPQTGDTFFEDLRVVVDPKMKKILDDNPEFLYCGNTEIRTIVNPATGKTVQQTTPSMPLSVSEFKKGQLNNDAFNRTGNP